MHLKRKEKIVNEFLSCYSDIRENILLESVPYWKAIYFWNGKDTKLPSCWHI